MKPEQEKMKAAMVAAVAEALNYKEINPKIEDEDIISHILRSADKIINKID